MNFSIYSFDAFKHNLCYQNWTETNYTVGMNQPEQFIHAVNLFYQKFDKKITFFSAVARQVT